MNIGQILETHLGWALHAKGETAATAVFDGATEEQIRTSSGARHMATAEACRDDGKIELRDGRTGEAFDRDDHRRLHLHAQAPPPGGGQDPRPVDRPVQPHHPAAAGRQGPVRRPALRRDGGLGARGLRRRQHPPGAADREVGRRPRARPDLRGHRQGRGDPAAAGPRVLQGPHQGASQPRPQRRDPRPERRGDPARRGRRVRRTCCPTSAGSTSPGSRTESRTPIPHPHAPARPGQPAPTLATGPNRAAEPDGGAEENDARSQ